MECAKKASTKLIKKLHANKFGRIWLLILSWRSHSGVLRVICSISRTQNHFLYNIKQCDNRKCRKYRTIYILYSFLFNIVHCTTYVFSLTTTTLQHKIVHVPFCLIDENESECVSAFYFWPP